MTLLKTGNSDNTNRGSKCEFTIKFRSTLFHAFNYYYYYYYYIHGYLRTYALCIFLIISGAVQLETQRACLKVPIYFKLTIILKQYKNNIKHKHKIQKSKFQPTTTTATLSETNKTNRRSQYSLS